MSIVDLHQDIILSYQSDINQFFVFDADTYQDIYNTNVGSLIDYKLANIQTVVAAVRPFELVGDLTDTLSRKISYSSAKLQQYIHQYKMMTKQQTITLLQDKLDFDNNNLHFLLHVEGLGGDITISTIDELYQGGVRSLGFVWNFDNQLCKCNLSSEGGLSNLGRQVVEFMNYKGMIIDTAHMNHQSMMDVVAHSKKPVMNSHSNLSEFYQHSRNVNDDFLIALAKNGGVLGLSLCASFIGPNETTIQQYLDQISYVHDLIGDDHIAFGSDYHGITHNDIVIGMNHLSGVPKLYNLIHDTFGSHFSEKFFFKNALRIIKDTIET